MGCRGNEARGGLAGDPFLPPFAEFEDGLAEELLNALHGKTIKGHRVLSVGDNGSVIELQFTDGTLAQVGFYVHAPKGTVFLFDARGEVTESGELEAGN